ncbi:hypothetical protein AO826_19195 [Xanthomonas phaseoli pv. manihotis]|nr:hypothetical protein AO826_19195 [Xanthomonas phaseoli pv. manihotis]
MLLKQFCLDIRIRFRDLLDMVRQVTVPIDLLLPGFPKMLGESGIFKPRVACFFQRLTRHACISTTVVKLDALTIEDADRHAAVRMDGVQTDRELSVDCITRALRHMATVALPIGVGRKTLIDTMLTLQLGRSNSTHLDLIALLLQAFDQCLRCPLPIAQRGVEDEVLFFGSRCHAQLIGPRARVLVGSTRPFIRIFASKVSNARMVAAQLIRIDCDGILIKLGLRLSDQSTLTRTRLAAQNDCFRLLLGC